MTTEVARYSVEHVTPELMRIAVLYVQQYRGDFPYLLNVRNRIATMGEKSLTRYMAKGVLNCMLHDPNVRNLPPPRAVIFDVEEIEEVHVTRRRTRFIGSTDPHAHVNDPRHRIKVVDLDDPLAMAADDWERREIDRTWGESEEPPRLNPYRRVEMKSRWNYDYGVSTAKRACRVHIVDHSVPAVVWRHGEEGGPHVSFQLKWLCKNLWSMGRSANYELMDHGQAVYVAYLVGWDWCKLCQQANEEQNVQADREPGTA